MGVEEQRSKGINYHNSSVADDISSREVQE